MYKLTKGTKHWIVMNGSKEYGRFVNKSDAQQFKKMLDNPGNYKAGLYT
jgi:hypothetical protein